MLDNDKQINAYNALSAAEMITPAPVVVCQEIVAQASAQAAAASALILPATNYPSSVSVQAGKIPVYAASFANAAGAAGGFIDAVKPYSAPSELLQLKTGWDCHVRGNRLAPAPAFTLVEAMGDTVITAALRELLQQTSLADLQAAMETINAKVSAAAGASAADSSGTAAPTAEPTFSADEIAALDTAIQVLDAGLASVAAQNTALSDYTNRVNISTSTAKKALSNAVAIALTDGLRTDSVMGPAITAIMPAAVLAALN